MGTTYLKEGNKHKINDMNVIAYVYLCYILTFVEMSYECKL